METARKIIKCFYGHDLDYKDYLDLSYKREGQDVRYALSDAKLRSLGWSPEKVFDKELHKIVKYYKDNFKW